MTEASQTATTETCRAGVVVDPVTRIDAGQIEAIHAASMQILQDPGILCFNEDAAGIYGDNGCAVERSDDQGAWIVQIPETVVRQAIESAPSRVVLGARDPASRLVLDAEEPRIYFGTGSETNVFLETEIKDFQATDDASLTRKFPVFREDRGSIARLCDSARLCNALENVDFFIRNVNVQDERICADNKDVNVFFAALMYMQKHVQAGLTNIEKLDDVLKLADLIAGGEEARKQNPVVSFIACLVKSPLQMVDDTTQKVIEITRRGCPLVVSSSPQGGSTAPIQEEGMTAQINAEILAGITLGQLVHPGTPVLYGAVPVRSRLDTLHDLYGAPEFIHYNIDCIQMARHYRIPCYSTAGVGDTGVPGLEAGVEKLLSHLAIAQAGAQYIHYAFGLLDRTSIFCPAQAVIDNANVGIVKQVVRQPRFDATDTEAAVKEVRKVLKSSSRLFARHIRKQRRRGVVSEPYPLESDGTSDAVIANAVTELERIRSTPGERLDDALVAKICQEIPGLLPQTDFDL